MTMKGLVFVHSFDSEEDGDPINLPEGWENQVQGSSGWQTLFPDMTGNPANFGHCWRVLDTARDDMLEDTDGVFCIIGEPADLTTLKATAAWWGTITEVRAGGDATAISIRDRWLDDRPGDPPEGEIAALRRTMAGFECPQIMEDTLPGDVA